MSEQKKEFCEDCGFWYTWLVVGFLIVLVVPVAVWLFLKDLATGTLRASPPEEGR